MKLIAVYAGTFDPITYGHIEVIKRGAKLFDQIIVAVAESARKKPILPLQVRIEQAQQLLGNTNIKVEPFSGLLIDFVRQKKANVILRGLRAVSDFDYEFQLYGMNHKMASDIETIFLPANENVSFISSSMVREIIAMGGDASAFVPPSVIENIKKYL